MNLDKHRHVTQYAFILAKSQPFDNTEIRCYDCKGWDRCQCQKRACLLTIRFNILLCTLLLGICIAYERLKIKNNPKTLHGSIGTIEKRRRFSPFLIFNTLLLLCASRNVLLKLTVKWVSCFKTHRFPNTIVCLSCIAAYDSLKTSRLLNRSEINTGKL